MSTILYNSTGDIITNLVSDVLPTVDTNKISNRLLDGSYHIQSIGSDIMQINIVCHLTEAGKSILDRCYATDEPVKLVFYNTYYVGLIMDAPKWVKAFRGDLLRRRYTASFSMVVSEEGVV